MKKVFKGIGITFLAVIALIIGIAFATAGGGDETTTAEAGTSEEKAKESPEKKEKEVPAEFDSALTSAEGYLDMMGMSKEGLLDQLTSEAGDQFSDEAAEYAVENVEVDWNEEALESAKSYQETMAMSPDAILDQLTSEAGEQFTEEQAQYAVDNLDK